MSSVTIATVPTSETRKWHPVWEAFRSELSAKGFADHLKRLTQHEFRVRRQSAWTYQVEFAYATDTELTEALDDIQTRAGVVFTR